MGFPFVHLRVPSSILRADVLQSLPFCRQRRLQEARIWIQTSFKLLCQDNSITCIRSTENKRPIPHYNYQTGNSWYRFQYSHTLLLHFYFAACIQWVEWLHIEWVLCLHQVAQWRLVSETDRIHGIKRDVSLIYLRLSAWLRERSWFLWLWLLGDGLSLCTPSRYQWTRNLTSFLDRSNAARCYVAFVCALVVLRSLPFLRISACSFGIVKTRPHTSLFSSRSLVSRSCPGILPLWIIALFVVASTTRLPWRDPVHPLWSAPLIL